MTAPLPLVRTLAVVGSLVTAGLALAPSAPAANAAPAKARPATPSSSHAVPGKGDRDGDKIADDLAAALAAAAPGDRLRVIVQGAHPAAAKQEVSSLAVDRTYHLIRGFAGSVPAGQVRALTHVSGVTRIELNGTVQAADASGDQDYGVNAARAAGAASDGTLDGSGVGICFIDTGVDPNHEAVAGRIAGWQDWVNDRTTPYDDHGHGTHVAGIAAGSPASPTSSYGGVARGASIIAAKVLAANGIGEDADVVSAIEWCAARADVDVISMSLGSPGSDGSDAGSQAADAAVAAGKVVVAAAGNEGDAPRTISSPGVATDVITVGAASDPSTVPGTADVDTGLYLAGFSSRGPTTNPEAPTKPDVVAPGISVLSAKAGTTSGYVSMSGTSMATPFVAGVVALGIEAAPSATPIELKQALRSSSHDAGPAGPDNDWGAGLVDARAFLAALGAAPAGGASWQAQQLVTGTVAANATVDFPFSIGTAGRPLGVTLRTVNGNSTCILPVNGSCWYGYEWSPDIDAYLVNPAGTVVAMSRCMLEATNGNCGAPGRFETLGIDSAAAGTWKLRVESYAGAGTFEATVIGALGTAPPPPTSPAAPTGVSAGATGTSTIDVTWVDASSNEEGFTVERCQGVGCSTFATVATRPAGSTSYGDSGLAAGTAYTYRVRSFNADGESAWVQASATTQTPPLPAPAAPTGLSVVSSSTSSISLVWTDNATNETGYTLQRCQAAGCTTFATVATLGAGATSYVDTGLAAGTTYSYRLAAFNASGPSAWTQTTASTAILTVPTAPGSPTASVGASGNVNLAWVDRSGNESGFRVLRCRGGSCTPSAVIATLAAGTTSYRDTTVKAGVVYRYRIQAYNAAGSANSTIVKVTTPR